MNRYEGRRVLITGGGSGIGRATVHRILAEGGRVHTVDVDEAGLKATADRATADGHADRLTTALLDISDENAVKEGVAAAVDALGGIDVLVNAAGILRSAHTHLTTLDLWNQVIGVNLTGTFLMIRESLPALLAGDRPAVVNFSSTSASFAHPYMSAYAASKGGIQSMTHALAAEYSKQGLRFVSVAPGSIESGMTTGNGPGLPEDTDWSSSPSSPRPSARASPARRPSQASSPCWAPRTVRSSPARRSASTAARTTDQTTAPTTDQARNRSHSRGKRSASTASFSKSSGAPSGSAACSGMPRSGATAPVSCSYASSAAYPSSSPSPSISSSKSPRSSASWSGSCTPPRTPPAPGR